MRPLPPLSNVDQRDMPQTMFIGRENADYERGTVLIVGELPLSRLPWRTSD
jgi:hypothetical protein